MIFEVTGWTILCVVRNVRAQGVRILTRYLLTRVCVTYTTHNYSLRITLSYHIRSLHSTVTRILRNTSLTLRARTGTMSGDVRGILAVECDSALLRSTNRNGEERKETDESKRNKLKIRKKESSRDVFSNREDEATIERLMQEKQSLKS